MKKYVFAIMAAAALAGCTNDEWVDNGTPQDGEDKVPILMSAGLEASVASTKAPVNGTAFTAGEDRFNLVAYTANTLNGAEYFDGNFVPMDGDNSSGSMIFSCDPAQYYPSSGDLYFAAFAPVTGMTWTYATGANPTVKGTIDGSQDIMVANNEIGTAYNKSSQTRPALQFKHLLRRFDFDIKASADVDEVGANIKAKSVTIVTAQKTSATLDLKAGTLSFAATPTASLTYTLTTATKIPENDETALSLGSIMCEAVTTNTQTTWDIKVTLEDGNDTELTGKLTFTPPTGGDAGKKYTVNLTYSLKEIQATATITDWVSAGGAITVPVQ